VDHELYGKITGIITNPKETMKNIAQEPLIEEAVYDRGDICDHWRALRPNIQSLKIKLVFENVTQRCKLFFRMKKRP